MYFIQIDLNRDFSVVTTEFVDIHDPRTFNDEIPIMTYNAVLDHGVNKAGSCSFTVPYNNPYINELFMYQTVNVIRISGVYPYIEWSGRIISIDQDIYLNKIVTCEGAFTYLNDITMTPVTYNEYSPLWFRLYTICGDHGQKCSPKRQIGTHVDPIIRTKFGDMKFIQSIDRKTAYEEVEEITSKVDCSIVMEYMLDGIISIFNVCELPYNPPDSKLEPQSISLGENILDYMQSITMDDVCTKICPIGKDGLTLTGSTFYDAGNFISDEYLIKKYGVVEQIKTYEEIDNVPDLRRAAENEMWAYRSAEFASFEISAFDLSLLNPELEPIQIGRGYYVKSLPHGVNDIFACTNAYIDISNPANSKYKFDNLALKRSRDRNYLTYQTSKTNRISTPMPQEKPTKIVKKSSNKVVQEFADYKVIIEAEGEGDERTNFKRTIIGNETPPMPESYIST